MTEGLNTYKSDGTLQFSSSFMTRYCVGKYTVTSVAGDGGHYTNISKIHIPISSDRDDFIAVRSLYPIGRYIDATISGQLTQVWLSDGPIGHTVEYFVFRRNVEATGLPNSGFETYNSAGQRTFHVGVQACVVHASLSGVGSSVTLDSPRSYAAICPAFGGHNKITDQEGPLFQDGDKPSDQYWYYEMTQDAKLYGVQFSDINYRTVTLVTISLSDERPRYLVANSGSPPPYATLPQVFAYAPLDGVMVVDVTGF